ncbi:MAG: hypothetical protein M3288_06695, partial [Thermoproteota archaeon]|nr:hypothetical protein [Thermoproteota archaeon]
MYLTVHDNSILEIARNARVVNTWDTFRKLLLRHGDIEAVHTKYCRSIYATFLRQCGIEQEIISLYQGRTPVTIFQAHY